jgi:hypothetical protein
MALKKKTTAAVKSKKAVAKSAARVVLHQLDLKDRPGIYYSPVYAANGNSSAENIFYKIEASSACQSIISATREIHYAMNQKIVIAMPVPKGMRIAGVSVYYQIVYPAGVRNTTRTYISPVQLVEYDVANHASVNLLTDNQQLNQTMPSTYTTNAGLAANKTSKGPLTCLLQIVIGDPNDCILIGGIKLITG